RQGKMGSRRHANWGAGWRGNRGGAGLDWRNCSSAGTRSDSGAPIADAVRASAAGSDRQRGRSTEGTDGDGSEYAIEPPAVARKSGLEGVDGARGRYAVADESGGAHGDPLRTGALPEGRSQSERGPPDDGAHEPSDGLTAADSEAAGRKDEQGRHSGGVARRHS